MGRIAAVLAGIAVLGLAPVASADITWSGAHWLEGITGFSGDWLTCLIGDNEYLSKDHTQYGLSQLTIEEVNNNGKRIWIGGRELGTTASDDDLGFDELSGNLVFIGSANSVDLGTNRYIRGVRVCTNDNDGHKIKGLGVRSAYVDSQGTYFEDTGSADSWEQANCDTWHKWLTCPTGEIAVGVRMNYEDEAFIGLELKCAELQF